MCVYKCNKYIQKAEHPLGIYPIKHKNYYIILFMSYLKTII